MTLTPEQLKERRKANEAKRNAGAKPGPEPAPEPRPKPEPRPASNAGTGKWYSDPTRPSVDNIHSGRMIDELDRPAPPSKAAMAGKGLSKVLAPVALAYGAYDVATNEKGFSDARSGLADDLDLIMGDEDTNAFQKLGYGTLGAIQHGWDNIGKSASGYDMVEQLLGVPTASAQPQARVAVEDPEPAYDDEDPEPAYDATKSQRRAQVQEDMLRRVLDGPMMGSKDDPTMETAQHRRAALPQDVVAMLQHKSGDRSSKSRIATNPSTGETTGLDFVTPSSTDARDYGVGSMRYAEPAKTTAEAERRAQVAQRQQDTLRWLDYRSPRQQREQYIAAQDRKHNNAVRAARQTEELANALTSAAEAEQKALVPPVSAEQRLVDRYVADAGNMLALGPEATPQQQKTMENFARQTYNDRLEGETAQDAIIRRMVDAAVGGEGAYTPKRAATERALLEESLKAAEGEEAVDIRKQLDALKKRETAGLRPEKNGWWYRNFGSWIGNTWDALDGVDDYNAGAQYSIPDMYGNMIDVDIDELMERYGLDDSNRILLERALMRGQ